MAELKAHYDALVQKLREAMVANTNNGTSRKPTLGEAALYQLERLQQLMGNTLHDGDAIVYGTGPDPARAQIPQAVKMRAAQYVTGSMNNAWNQILTGANRFGDSMRSFGMVDFWNNTRADELLGLFVPFSFWKTRTIKNSLERMVREPRWFGYAVRLERALEQQSRTQPYQISQDEEQRILSPFEQTQQYPKRFEFNVGLGGLNIGGSQWDMLARSCPATTGRWRTSCSTIAILTMRPATP